jgi:hypothetical protein
MKFKMITFGSTSDQYTKWLYDTPTGLLTNKVYDEGNGPSYSYYPNGKLYTHAWATALSRRLVEP